jgi:hypothetical protein
MTAKKDPGPLLWPEEVAARLGVQYSTVIYNASKTRRRKAARQPIRPTDMPLPYDHKVRQVPAQHGKVRYVKTPRWQVTVIDAYIAARREAGTLPETSPELAAS